MELDVITAFSTRYEKKPDVVASAPGVVHLLGEHCEYARTHTLSFALPWRFHVALAGRNDNTVDITTSLGNEHKRFSLQTLRFRKEDRWANYVKGVIQGLDNLGCSLGGLDIYLHSEIPEGKGLGASSAYCLAVTMALVKLWKFTLSDAQMLYVAHTAETQFLEQPSKVSTVFTSLFAHSGAFFTMDLRSLDFHYLRLNSPEHHFYLVDSKVSPSSSREEYELRARDYQVFRDKLRPHIGKREPRDVDPKELKDLASELPQDLRRIAFHLSSEEERHHQACDAVEAGNINALGRILSRSHENLRDVLDVSCPELDWLSRHDSLIPGALGTRLTGRGFGAYALLFARGERDEIESHFGNFASEYERLFTFRLSLKRVMLSEGASVKSFEELAGDRVQ